MFNFVSFVFAFISITGGGGRWGERGRWREMEGDGGRWREMEGDGGRWREMEGDGGRWREMGGDGEGEERGRSVSVTFHLLIRNNLFLIHLQREFSLHISDDETSSF